MSYNPDIQGMGIGPARTGRDPEPAPRGQIRGGVSQMTNHPKRSGEFELVFVGGISRRYRRRHKSFDAAQDLAGKILSELDDRAAHPAIIYGPDCGRDGFTIS